VEESQLGRIYLYGIGRKNELYGRKRKQSKGGQVQVRNTTCTARPILVIGPLATPFLLIRLAPFPSPISTSLFNSSYSQVEQIRAVLLHYISVTLHLVFASQQFALSLVVLFTFRGHFLLPYTDISPRPRSVSVLPLLSMELAQLQHSSTADDLPKLASSFTPRPTVITSLAAHPPSNYMTDHGTLPSASLSPQSYHSPWLESSNLTSPDLVTPYPVRIRSRQTSLPLQ